MVIAMLAGAACARVPAGPGAPEPVVSRPRPEAAARPGSLPAVPPVDGPLNLDLVYPPEGAAIAAADSTFVFGSTGSGYTQLNINGQVVRVAPNGAFLGYLPVPADGVYRVEADRRGERARLERTVRVPEAGPPTNVGILPGSAYPTGSLALAWEERVEVGFRGTPGGVATLLLPTGQRILLTESFSDVAASDAANFQRSASGTGTRPAVAAYRGFFTVQGALAGPVPGDRPALANSLPDWPDSTGAQPAVFELIVGGQTVREVLRLSLMPLDPNEPRVAVVQAPAGAALDWTARGRNGTSGPFHYFWPAGTQLTLTGERNGMLRVALARDRIAWVPSSEVRMLPQGWPPAKGVVGGARMAPYRDFVDLRVPLPERMPYFVEEETRALHLSVFGATSAINFFQYGGLDPLIERAEWSQPAEDVLRFTIHLTAPVWGYDTFFDGSGALIFRIRRPPEIDPDRPLAGMLVGLDAGHPPGGAIGPTRMTEADANLGIAQKLRPMLEAAGARVLMIRKGGEAVDLAARPRMAVDSNAHVLLSVHNNAFPDGVNPFENNGTSVYYFQAHSADMATRFQEELVRELGLRDLGIGRADLALVRPTWMPSVLTETSFLMVPEQEAALRDAGTQERIARAHLRALEAFLRERAAAAR